LGFCILSADEAAFRDARGMGISNEGSLMFSKSQRGNDAAWSAASERISARRSGVADKVSFDDTDRAASE
jgi:hypothetical protein